MAPKTLDPVKKDPTTMKAKAFVEDIRLKILTSSDNLADLATERERQLTMARAKQTTGLTNGRAANWAPEVVFCPLRALSSRQLTFQSCC